ncbi:MAG: aspartyl protease family protein [Phycisphaeraceae bacterium]
MTKNTEAMPFSRGIPTKARLALGLSIVLSATQASAIEVVLGPADSLALDQPRIVFGLTDESTTPGTVIGPTLNTALLDTGANGILLAGLSYRNGENYGQPAFAFDYDGSGVIDADEQLAQYAELGVAGTTLLDVHDPFGLRIEDSDGVERLVGTNVRAFGDRNLNIGSYAAIVGMPAMQGLAVEIDMRPNLNIELQRVAFHDTMAQATLESAATTNVDLRIIEPEYTDPTFINAGRPDLLPTFAGLPVIDNVDMRHTGGANSGGVTRLAEDYTFLVDTGAQTMIINEQMATDLGIDFGLTVSQGGDIVDFLEVGGIGGTVFMPLVSVDSFILPTQGDLELVWTDILVGVLDIDGAPFDAVFGMNMLTTGYLGAAFGGGGGASITNSLINEEALSLLIDLGTVNEVDDLFDQGLILISREEYDILVESQILPDTDDPLVAYTAAKDLDDQLGVDASLTQPLFDKVVFDFTPTDGTAVMRLDFNESVTIPEPNSLILLTLAGAAILSRRRRFIIAPGGSPEP